MIPLLFMILAQQPAPGAAPTPAELVKQLDATQGVKDKDKPFEIALSLARLYASQGRFSDARAYITQAMEKAAPVRAFYLSHRVAKPGTSCPGVKEITMAGLFAAAQEAERAGRAKDAASCAALSVKDLLDAETEAGELAFLAGDVDGALAAFERALQTNPGSPAARYGKAATLIDARGEDVAQLTLAVAELERFLADAPSSPRAPQAKRLKERAAAAIAAGGMSRLPAVVAAASPPPPQGTTAPPQLSPEVIAAFQNTPVTKDMEQGFEKAIAEGEEHLARGRFTEARASYLQVMPYQPNNPRLQAGMAWTMIKLNRQPMADNVWRAAVQNPDAVAALGDTLKAKGDVEGARALWTRLKDTVPSYAPRLAGKL